MRPRTNPADLLRVPTDLDLEEDEDELSEKSSVDLLEISDVDSSEDAELLEDDADEEPRPLDELLQDPNEPAVESSDTDEE